MKAPETKTILNVALIIGLFFVGKKVFEKLGIFKTNEEQKVNEDVTALTTGASSDASVIDKNNPALAFSPNYYNTIYQKVYIPAYRKALNNPKVTPNYNALLKDVKSFVDLAQLVYDAKSVLILPDKESKAFGVFRNLKSQFQISYLAMVFFRTYKKDMLEYIQTFFNDEQLSRLYDIIKNKKLF